MMTRKALSLLLSLLLCFSVPVAVSAEAVSAVTAQPYYETAQYARSQLNINGTSATCKSTIQGNLNVTKIVAEQYLQKQGFLWIWTTYNNAEWTKTANSISLSMSNTKSGLSSGKYRLKTIFTLTDKQGKTETITVYSDQISV